MTSFILTDKALTLFASSDRVVTIDVSHPNWHKIMEALKKEDFQTIIKLADVASALTDYFGTAGLTVRDGVVYYNNKRVDNYATDKAIQFMRAGLPYKPLLGFIERVMKNPSHRAVQDLYTFLEHGKLPLTKDGHFLAYKKVKYDANSRLVDIYTSSFSNNPGDIVEMARNEVDEDPDRTCSKGLHVCSYDYLEHYGTGPGDAVILVQIDPADVVAVPRDYNNTKMRVCKYQVLSIFEKLDRPENLWSGVAYFDEEDDMLEDDECEVDEDECPRCGSWVDADDTFCRSCGRML